MIFKLLLPVEWVLVLGAGLLYGLYTRLDLPLPGQPGLAEGSRGATLFYFKQLYTCCYLWALIFILQFVRATWITFGTFGLKLGVAPFKESWELAAKRLYPAEALKDFRLLHAVVLMFVQFQLLKHLIPQVNHRVYDRYLLRGEELVCAGRLCGEWLHRILGEGVLHTVSEHYHWYFPFMIASVVAMVAFAPRKEAEKYVCSFVLLFLIGILWVYFFPTWGPAFYTPERFAFIRESGSGALQHELWQMKLRLDAAPRSLGDLFMISGFPSLHVAVVLLAALKLKLVHPLLSLIGWCFVLLIINSTLYLGWHYIWDDLGSVLLVYAALRCTKRLYREKKYLIYRVQADA